MRNDIDTGAGDWFVERLEHGLSQVTEVTDLSGKTIVVGVSGGADSVAMLVGLNRLSVRHDFHCHVVHVNHCLRAEADNDAKFVMQLASELGITCDVIVSDAGAAAAEQGVGLEEAGRTLRYAAFVKVAKANDSQLVAVAHHQDDQVETVLHHIIRGTGLTGLGGIPSTRNLNDDITLIRPMLEMSRADVLRFIKEQDLEFREDESNAENQFTRNRIRNDLLPLLERDYNPQVGNAIARLSSQARESSAWIEESARELFERVCSVVDSKEVRIRCDVIRDTAPVLLRAMLRRVWREQRWPERKMGFDEWNSLASLIESGEAGRDFPGGVNASRKRAVLTLRRKVSG